MSACVLSLSIFAASARNSSDAVQQREMAGDLAGARALLQKEASDGTSPTLRNFAIFLDRHAEDGRRDAYLKWGAAEKDPQLRSLALKQVVLIDFMDGNEAELNADLQQYRAAGGQDLQAPARGNIGQHYSMISIPGPLSSFARMAALAPDLAPEELLPALARNVVTNGYEASGNEALQQTEYLRLLVRYVGQARELQAMARNRKIVIPACDSEETGALLKVLGYRMRGACGGDMVLETVNATRAFLTADSAFPLTELEQDLRANHRFELAYAPTQVPVLYDAQYWIQAVNQGSQADFLDAFVSDPSICRLYLGLSHLDRTTAAALRQQATAAKLKVYAHVLDFFGSMFQIRDGAAVVPGSPKAWASMVGVSPNNPGAFFEKLLATDDGWMASYFDVLSRIDGPTQAYLTQPERMKRFYDALRGKITSPGPARPVFRSSTELMLLTTSLRIDPDGQPHVPGDVEVWRNLFIHHPHGKYDGKLTRSAASWKNNDDVIEALFGLSRKSVENEPLKIFLALNDIDRGRAKPMSSQLAAQLVAGYRSFGAQYALFADAPALSEGSIRAYVDTCRQIKDQHDTLLRGDTLGTFQALTGLWRILVLQDAIPVARQDASFAKLIEPFAHIKQASEVFDGGRSGIDTLLGAAGKQPGSMRQEQMVELLAGKLRPQNGAQPAGPADTFLRVFDAQLLVSIDTLFAIADRAGKQTLDSKTVKSLDEQLSRLQETLSLRSSISAEERSTLAIGYWSDRHVDQEKKVNLDKLIKNTDKRDARDLLAPFLRDSLVGYLYSYYAPAGAQLLLTNSSLVRGHDFVGPESSASEWSNTEVAGSGWPESAGGRLVGSLITLPYAIAEAEQNFLSPKREQALIWADLVPQLIVDETVNRWKNVTPEQIRWIGLHVRRGESLLAAAGLNASVETAVLNSYRRFALPARVEWLQDRLQSGDYKTAVADVPTSTLYALSIDPKLANVSPDIYTAEIAEIASENDPALTPEAIAHTFGTPKPTLTHSLRPRLLYLRTFPALMGYSSRILAESWESNNIYYAALADQTGVPVDRLDAYVPEWNRATIENIFATHLEDWPALLRSLHAVGRNIQQERVLQANIRNSEN
ncbi:MAG: hypothetical protein JO051_09350 [Acidobacteriaceae bacterium]|nr:hypothetical protein [Acidobacteriaceae bacterium]